MHMPNVWNSAIVFSNRWAVCFVENEESVQQKEVTFEVVSCQ